MERNRSRCKHSLLSLWISGPFIFFAQGDSWTILSWYECIYTCSDIISGYIGCLLSDAFLLFVDWKFKKKGKWEIKLGEHFIKGLEWESEDLDFPPMIWFLTSDRKSAFSILFPVGKNCKRSYFLILTSSSTFWAIKFFTLIFINFANYIA